MHLLYITDVFCPWCYGFIPVMRRLSRDHPSLPVRVLGGNLVESPQRISEMLEEHPALPAFFERLEQTTGQTTARFRELVKASSGGEQNWLMHSAAMNLPLAALRRLAPGHELEQMEAFEEGFYSEARDVMAPDFWDRIAARWGISQTRLQTALHDPAVQQAAEEDAREAEDIMGEFCLYPTLYLEQGGGRTLLARGYVPYERVKAVARAEEAQKQAQSKSAAMISIADRLASMSEVMASASSQLAERISQADQASQESSARLSDAAAAIGQMNASVSEVASNASSAAQASTSTKEKAEAGAHIVEKVVHSIEEIYQVSTALKQDMEQLNAHAQAINDIMVVISDIADQTNLLALNAAIEAARAGEAGRGFAVVADEVRKLAEKTMSSTQDVATAIRAIQGSTEQSVRAMEAVAQKVGEANQFAGDSGKALQAIVATVENAAMQVHAIATASEEQSAASEEINRGIMQVDSMAKQNLDAMNQAAQAVQQLVSQAGTLNTLVHELREA